VVLTTPLMLGSVSAPLLALRCVMLRYAVLCSATALLAAKKAFFDAKSAGAQCSGHTLAPCARSVSTDLWNCANAMLKAKKALHPVRVALAQICKTALMLF
jgi:hypothetical protein